MKTKMCAFFLSLAIFLTFHPFAHSAPFDTTAFRDPVRLASTYFQCIRDGNTSCITGLLGGKLLNRKKNLLVNQSGTYSQFLKSLYGNASLDHIDIQPSGAHRAISTIHFFQGENPGVFKLILDEIDNEWKVIDEVKD